MTSTQIKEKIERYRKVYPENSEDHLDDLDLLEFYKMISGKDLAKYKVELELQEKEDQK